MEPANDGRQEIFIKQGTNINPKLIISRHTLENAVYSISLGILK